MKILIVAGLVVLMGVSVHASSEVYLSTVGDARLQVRDVSSRVPMVYAQSGGGQRMRAGANNQGASVAADVSFGQDITALFRFSRWRRPFATGGVVSWLNPGAWSATPYRTITVLAGELIFIGTSAAIVEAFDSDDSSGGEPEPAPTPATTSSSSGSSSSSPEPEETTPTSSGGGSSAPAPSSGGGGFESPF